MQVILTWSVITLKTPAYGTVKYPTWGLVLGWCMVIFIIMWIFGIAVYKLLRAKGTPWQVCTWVCVFTGSDMRQSTCSHIHDLNGQRVKALCRPSEEWHPYLDVHRGERYSEDRCRHKGKSVRTQETNVNVITSSWL